MADAQTRLAIQYLTAVMQRQDGVIPSRSVVIRHYLIEAYKKAYAKEAALETALTQQPVLDVESALLAATVEDSESSDQPDVESKNRKRTSKKKRTKGAT